MDDLIKALIIFRMYLDETNDICPTHCEHDELWIMGVDPEDVSDADHSELLALGFYVDEYDNSYKSFRFGSA
jgi:hypothetical protein